MRGAETFTQRVGFLPADLLRAVEASLKAALDLD